MSGSPHTLIVFDCDGTLLDSQDLIVLAMNEAFDREGRPAPQRETTLSIVGLSLIEAMQVIVPDAEPAEHVRLATAYKTAFGDIISDTSRKEPLYEGAEDTVRRLSARDDVVLGIATGKSQRGVRRVLSQHDLADCFVTIQTADDAPSKPHPAMLHQAMAEAGAAPAHSIMIGDTTYDLEMANAARVHGIGVSWGYHPHDHLAPLSGSKIANDFADLDAIIDNVIAGR